PTYWQSFPTRRSSDLLLSGRTTLRLTGAEKKVLKLYVHNGGLLLAESGGQKDFEQSFKTLVKELWPTSALEELDKKHPVWSAKLDRKSTRLNSSHQII